MKMQISFPAAALTSHFWLILGVAVLGVAGLGIVIVFLLLRTRRPVSRPVDESGMETMIKNLGGLENITGVSLDGARLKFTVRNVDRCDLPALRGGGALGIFVSGNAVKFMLTADSDRVVDRINAMKKGETS